MRAKDKRRFKLLFQTAVAATAQKTQQIIKSAFGRAGIEVDLKAVTPSVYFGGDAANPDNSSRFLADLQMFSVQRSVPDPKRLMDRFGSWELPSKANKFQGRSIMRWRSDEYDRAYRAAETEMDAAQRAALFIRLNDLVVGDGYMIPLLSRMHVNAAASKLVKPQSTWGLDMATLADWYRAS